jgi:hypothetical protein
MARLYGGPRSARKDAQITEPHAKSVQGSAKLYELRPGGGKALIRPLYFRRSEQEYVILAVAPESVVDPSGFKAAVARANDRAVKHFGVHVA